MQTQRNQTQTTSALPTRLAPSVVTWVGRREPAETKENPAAHTTLERTTGGVETLKPLPEEDKNYMTKEEWQEDKETKKQKRVGQQHNIRNRTEQTRGQDPGAIKTQNKINNGRCAGDGVHNCFTKHRRQNESLSNR